jgi:large subunit ribosomal protein L4
MNNFVLIENNTLKKKAIGLIHKIFILSRRNNQKYLAHCKTRSEVRGGGRKPWKQKGTGRARAGSIRSPLWVGGGKSFGPRKHIVTKKINKKEKKICTLLLFFLKLPVFKIISDYDFNLVNFTQKDIKKLLVKKLLNNKIKTLLILENYEKNLWKFIKNNNNIELIKPNYLNVKSLLTANQIFLSKKSITILKKKFLYEIN